MRPLQALRRGCATLALLASAACDAGPSGAEFEGLDLHPGPHLLIDGYLIERGAGVVRVVHRPLRDPRVPNPLVTGVGDRNFTPYMTVLREGDRFRLWYNIRAPGDADLSHLGYLESADGIRWERPHRVLSDPAGRIGFGASIVPRPEGGYAFGYYQGGGLRVATSTDGFGWVPVQSREAVQQNHDIAGLTYDPIRKQYIGIISTLRRIETGSTVRRTIRVTGQSVSRNLVDWEAPWDVLAPDGRDEVGTEFYGLDGFLPRGGLLIAMAKVLRDDLDADGPPAQGSPRGIGYTSLAWSRDGRTWTRDRAIYLAPDPAPGSWDHAFAWVDQQLPVGDSVYLYYGGYQEGHKGDRSVDRQIGMLMIPRDRYAGWEAKGEGTIVSRLVRLHGRGLTFNVDAAEGELAVRVLGEDGADLLGTCEPITGNQLDAPLRCERDLASVSEPVRLELRLRNARLFAWTVTE